MNSLKHEDGFVSRYFQTFVTLFNSRKLKQNQIKPFSVNSKDWKLQKNDTIFSHFLNWFFGFLILRTWKLVWLNINWFGVVHFMLKDWGDCWLLKISRRRFETSEWASTVVVVFYWIVLDLSEAAYPPQKLLVSSFKIIGEEVWWSSTKRYISSSTLRLTRLIIWRLFGFGLCIPRVNTSGAEYALQRKYILGAEFAS